MESPTNVHEDSCSSEFVLESPKNVKEFESKTGQKWAREIVIDYWTRKDEGWLLAPMLKILSVMAKENPTPGGLSRSYCLEVFYKIGEQMTQQHWFEDTQDIADSRHGREGVGDVQQYIS